MITMVSMFTIRAWPFRLIFSQPYPVTGSWFPVNLTLNLFREYENTVTELFEISAVGCDKWLVGLDRDYKASSR